MDLPLLLNINTNVLSDFESCDTALHWPGGNSGPTIGRGIDLGNNSKKTIALFFKNVVSDSVLKLLQSASGVRGEAAKQWVMRHDIRITRKQADKSFYLTCRLMWNDVLRRNGHGLDTLDSDVKGILLSVAYNYGSHSIVVRNLARAYNEQGLAGMASQLEHMAEITEHPALKKRRMREREVLLLVAQASTGGSVAYLD
jgi:GH24 family phage-related lysozyme (muramidase)